jgi:hypothetical protein
MASDAFSTAVTAVVGSLIVPVARPWAAVDAVFWVWSSPLIALESAEPKLAEPVFAGWETDEADPTEPTEPTEAADPSAETPEMAGII